VADRSREINLPARSFARLGIATVDSGVGIDDGYLYKKMLRIQ
jgi:hypothetical protein